MSGVVAIAVVVVCVVLVGAWILLTINKLRRLKIQADNQLSNIDVALDKRRGVLDKAAAAVSSYAGHEERVIIGATEKRTGIESRKRESEQFDEAERRLRLQFENYPQLRASENYTLFQRQVSDVEEQLQASRRAYNLAAASYNEATMMIPASLVARLFGYGQLEYFTTSRREDEIPQLP